MHLARRLWGRRLRGKGCLGAVCEGGGFGALAPEKGRWGAGLHDMGAWQASASACLVALDGAVTLPFTHNVRPKGHKSITAPKLICLLLSLSPSRPPLPDTAGSQQSLGRAPSYSHSQRTSSTSGYAPGQHGRGYGHGHGSAAGGSAHGSPSSGGAAAGARRSGSATRRPGTGGSGRVGSG